jgi:hypothetical protein
MLIILKLKSKKKRCNMIVEDKQKFLLVHGYKTIPAHK